MLALLVSTALAFPADLAEIRITVVDPQATGYGTFQSHNQKVASTRGGVFMTHIRTRNEPYTAQTWRLSRAAPGATRFETVYEATHATNPPVIEADSKGAIHLVRPDFIDGNAYYYRFDLAKSYRDPKTSVIPKGAAGKFALELDESRGRLYYFAHNNTFHVLNLEGQVLSSEELLRGGKNAVLQYPLLSLDAAGRLYAAWTTQAHGRYLYWDIHCLRSEDGGSTWTTLAGLPLATPIICDDTGPADRISLADEFEAHTWLSSFLARDDKLHFAYLAQLESSRQHYVRFDALSGRRRRDTFPQWKGETLSVRNLDGFFAARKASIGSTIYYVSRDAAASRLACLASDDGGESWYDYAVSKPVQNPYSIGGAREITVEGFIVGSFTESTSSTADPGGGSRVCFFKIPGGRCHAAVVKCDVAGDDTKVVFANVRGQPEMVRFRRISTEIAALSELAEIAEANKQDGDDPSEPERGNGDRENPDGEPGDEPQKKANPDDVDEPNEQDDPEGKRKRERDEPDDADDPSDAEMLEELRQARELLRDAKEAGEWTEWRRFDLRLTLKGDDRPRAYQLRSRLKVVSPEVEIPEAAPEEK